MNRSPYSLGTVRLGTSRWRHRSEIVRVLGQSIFQSGAVLWRGPRVWIPMMLALTVMGTARTSATFSDMDTIQSQAVGTGQWIPHVSFHMTPEFSHNRAYEAAPCVTISSDLDTTLIYYEFSDDGDPRLGGMAYQNGCLTLPEQSGEIVIQAIAIHPDHDEWHSDVARITLSMRGHTENSDEHNDHGKHQGKDNDHRKHQDERDEEGEKTIDHEADKPYDSSDTNNHDGAGDEETSEYSSQDNDLIRRLDTKLDEGTSAKNNHNVELTEVDQETEDDASVTPHTLVPPNSASHINIVPITEDISGH